MDKDRQQNDNDRDQHSRSATSSNDPSHREPGAGITNRPDDQERENQDRLPPRGHAKDEP